jgi:hypothetical protein
VRHRRSRNYHGRHSAAPERNPVPAVALTACALAASATGILMQGMDHPAAPHPEASPLAASDLNRMADFRASRGNDRPDPIDGRAARHAPATAAPAPAAAPVPPAPAPAPPAHPHPVAGLNQAQMDNAAIIVKVGKERHLPKRAMVVAVATALQESDLYNSASSAVPESFRYPHQGNSVDHDSVGLFQQRSSQGWGTVAQLMNPAYSTGLFYSALVQVSDWQSRSIASAAQAVQRSAYPYAYQKHAARAQQIVDALY